MSTSGGNPSTISTPAAGKTVIFGGYTGNLTTLSNGTMYLLPCYLPTKVHLTALSANITAAGTAGATVTPVFYADDGHGTPAGLIVAGPALPADAIAAPSSPVSIDLPAGWLWSGMLILGGAPTVPGVEYGIPLNNPGPTGNLRQWGANSGGTAPFQTGLAAAPAQFGGAFGSTLGLVVRAST